MTVRQIVPPPRTRATNALELLDEVVQLISEEPQRLDMEDWIAAFMRSYPITFEALNDAGYVSLEPACGTVACVAGWIAVLTRSATNVSPENEGLEADLAAMKILLGLSDVDPEQDRRWFRSGYFPNSPDPSDQVNDTRYLFSPRLRLEAKDAGYPVDFGDKYDRDMPTRGTPEYVALVVARIRAYQERWRTQLLAVSITPAPTQEA